MSKKDTQRAQHQQAIGGIVGFTGVCLGIYIAIFYGGEGGIVVMLASLAVGWYITFYHE